MVFYRYVKTVLYKLTCFVLLCILQNHDPNPINNLCKTFSSLVLLFRAFMQNVGKKLDDYYFEKTQSVNPDEASTSVLPTL